MHSSAVLVAALAATVSANMRPVEIPLPKRGIEARQTDSTDQPTGTADAACMSAIDTIYSLVTNIPTPPADVASFVATQTDSDPCSVSIPNSLTSEYSSWTSQVLSWYSASAEGPISSAAAQCPSLTDGGSNSTDIGVCTTDVAVGSGTPGTSETSGTTSTGGGGAASASATTTRSSATGSSTTTAAASSKSSQAAAVSGRDVGIMGAVFAGILGAVAAL